MIILSAGCVFNHTGIQKLYVCPLGLQGSDKNRHRVRVACDLLVTVENVKPRLLYVLMSLFLLPSMDMILTCKPASTVQCKGLNYIYLIMMFHNYTYKTISLKLKDY
jgi:hypothetical protein